MNVAGVIAILVGILIISSRGHLLLFPDSDLQEGDADDHTH